MASSTANAATDSAMGEARGMFARAWCMLRLALHLLKGLVIALTQFPKLARAEREAHIKRWSHRLVELTGVEIKVIGEITPAQPRALIANHISWLDIFAINSLQPCAFVAKSELRSWPVAGLLLHLVGTLFIDRNKRQDVARMGGILREAMRDGRTPAVFPEGGIGDGKNLRPFHASLFQPFIDAQATIQPIAIIYREADGAPTTRAAFVDGLSFLGCVWQILAKRGMHVELHLLPPHVTGADTKRRELAATCEIQLQKALPLM